MANAKTPYGAYLTVPGAGNPIELGFPAELVVFSNITISAAIMGLLDTDGNTIVQVVAPSNNTIIVPLDGLHLGSIYYTGTGTTCTIVRKSR